MDSVIRDIAVYALPVIFAITLHEAAHGYVARMFGDSTAWMLGRVTINPIKHVDPVGTILVPGALLLIAKLFGGPFFLFGWARPVPVNFNNLRNPKRDMIWVAGAGPMANLLMAIAWAGMFKLLVVLGIEEQYFALVSAAGVEMNIMLMALNLVPIPPLDGGRILVGLLPQPLSRFVAAIEPYGFIVIILLLVNHILPSLMLPFVAIANSIVNALFNF